MNLSIAEEDPELVGTGGYSGLLGCHDEHEGIHSFMIHIPVLLGPVCDVDNRTPGHERCVRVQRTGRTTRDVVWKPDSGSTAPRDGRVQISQDSRLDSGSRHPFDGSAAWTVRASPCPSVEDVATAEARCCMWSTREEGAGSARIRQS